MADDLTGRASPCSPSNAQHRDSSLTSVISVTPDIARATECWTPARVEERLRKAVSLRSGPVSERLDAAITAGREPESIGIIGGIGSALPEDGDDNLVAHAAEGLSWLQWLEPDDAALVRARLAGAPWKSICWRFEISRPTADRRFRYAITAIAWRLNGNVGARRTPSLRKLLGMRRKDVASAVCEAARRVT